MFESEIKKANYAFLLAKYGGIEHLFTEIKRRIYHKTVSIGLEKDLNEPDIEIQPRTDYTLKLAEREDIEEINNYIKTEGKQSRLYLLYRKWFYDAGFNNCYIARSTDTNELCYMQWIISQYDQNSNSPIFKSSYNFVRLGEYDAQLENAYTFVKYRGKKIMPSVMNKLFQIARNRGFKRVITYVGSDNISSLKGCHSVGFKQFEQIHINLFLLSARRLIIPTRQPASSGNELISNVNSPVL